MDRRRFVSTTGSLLTAVGTGLGCRSLGEGGNQLESSVGGQTLPDEAFAPDIFVPSNDLAPLRLPPSKTRSVLVIGGGIAGLSAALELAERGYRVHIKESGAQCGGRLATREQTLKVGKFRIEHGLHMWFYQYYNFFDILRRLGTLESQFVPFDKVYYEFATYAPETISSDGPYPVNLVNIIRTSKNLNLLDAAGTFGAVKDIIFYNHGNNWEKFDDISFVDWAKKTRVNKKFWDIIMEPAASVTLNDPASLSAAEMLLYMHYYFIGHPKAFRRVVSKVDHGQAVIDPWVQRLTRLGAKVEVASRVKGLRIKDGLVQEAANQQHFDAVVLATDVKGAQRILEKSEAEDDASQIALDALRSKVMAQKVAPPYSVLRVFFDKPLRERPFHECVIETPQFRPINLIINFSVLEQESIAWCRARQGSILEYHLYTTPEFVGMAPDAIWQTIRPLALRVHPELEAAKALDFALGTYDNFSSFGVGEGRQRPTPILPRTLGLKNLTLAGDWIALSYPNALMERSVTTGREAANRILLDDGVRQALVYAAKSRGPGLVPQF